MKVNETYRIPKEVTEVSDTIKKAGFEAYLIGGCVRDLIIERKPKDWDFATNATPEQVQKLFDNTFYENEYGTVGISRETADPSLKTIEVTPYRLESPYSDKRRPDKVIFGKDIDQDLKRRDFTINSIAMDIPIGATVTSGKCIYDPLGGIEDINKKLVKTVGKPEERFEEDALRLLRAIRIGTELDFTIESETAEAIKKHADLLKHVSAERIRDELSRIIMTDSPSQGFILCHFLGLLPAIIPELEVAIGVEQNKAHSYDVWTHLMKTLDHSAKKKYPFHVRLSSLFHDIGKPATRNWSEDKKDWTFYGHDVIGMKITAKIMARLKFPKKLSDDVIKLVRWHMFFSDTETITLSAVRRLVSNVGKELIWDLMNLRVCDRIGTGRPKEHPYRLRKYQAMVEEAMRDPISVSMLKINGEKLISLTGLKPGPKIGYILHALLEEVLEDPKKNDGDKLEKRAMDMAKMAEEDIKKLGESGKNIKNSKEEKEVQKIRSKYFVK